ncbi:hypothetical protein AWC38_SpisGene21281 [Stylophora pistillata]|uniref:Protein-tyrosine sulfotransferase n=2 Tax=Stylophora pistillata TaxID=50429 RepID=A0A2B4RDJ4_STYPI|nr:hypothetical protein AWC38_SpisGene21281 [Stylophora pistillata]
MGDKKGGRTSELLSQDPSRIKDIEEIIKTVGAPVKFIHIVRNPFDNIATMLLRATGRRDSVREEGVKVNKSQILENCIKKYFNLTEANQRVRERFGDAVVDIPGRETVLRPKETLQKLCDHLGRRKAANRMFVRTGFFPLLVTGFLSSLFLATYVIFKETKISSPGRRMVQILETVTLTENVETPSLSYAEKLFKAYDEVETFVMFIGYPRSSHSLVGAILDAHPEIIIPHEFNLLQMWSRYNLPTFRRKNLLRYKLFFDLHRTSMEQAMFGIRASQNRTVLNGEFTYLYNVPKLWQGGYKNRIKVIGDKKGGKTSELLSHDPSRMKQLEGIAKLVGVPMKFIHIVRNPFDNIATMVLRRLGERNNVREEGVKVNGSHILENWIGAYFKLVEANQRVRERFGDAVIDIPGHETVLRPKETLQKLCDHLGVTCSVHYVEKCSRILYGTPSVTRDKIVWTKEQKQRVTELMKKYSFLKDFSFDDYLTASSG